MCIYGNHDHSEWFRQAWAKTGKKLDMGKSCIRFKKLDDLALDVIGEAIRRVPARKYIGAIESAMQARKGSAKPAKSKKPAARAKSKATRRK
jgi:hypothetical protein